MIPTEKIQELIDKWHKDLEMWKRVCEDPLMYTKEQRLRASGYVLSITAMINQLKELITPKQ